MNMAYVQFADNAVIKLLEDTTTVTNFSYLAPQLSGGTISIAARKGDIYGSYVIAHKDKLTPGTQGIVLTLPKAPTLDTPLSNATINVPVTPFKWSNPGNSVVDAAHCPGRHGLQFHLRRDRRYLAGNAEVQRRCLEAQGHRGRGVGRSRFMAPTRRSTTLRVTQECSILITRVSCGAPSATAVPTREASTAP